MSNYDKWLKKYVKEIMNFEKIDVMKEIKLMEEKKKYIPRKLYKYRSINNEQSLTYVIEEIKSGKIHFSSREKLNDPAESKSILGSSNPDYYLGVFDNKEYLCSLINFTFGEEGVKKYHNGEIQLKCDENEFIKCMRNFEMEENIEYFNEQWNDQFSWSRISSFTVDSKNTVMWGNYADNNRGICLEYTLSDEWLNCYYHQHLFPTIYIDKPIDIMKNPELQGKLDSQKIAMFKTTNWSYEQEWRFIFNKFENVVDKNGLFDFMKPSKVILGFNISEKNEKTIKKICNENSIKLTKMENNSNYGLKEVEVIL